MHTYIIGDMLQEILAEVKANSSLKKQVSDLEQRVLELQEGSCRRGRGKPKVLPSRKVRVSLVISPLADFGSTLDYFIELIFFKYM